MSALNARLSYLFNSYYNQTATAQEREELFQIINSSVNDTELTLLIQQAWNDLETNEQLFDPTKSMDMLNNILKNKADHDNSYQIRPPDNHIPWVKLGIAAALLVFVSFGAYVFIKQKKQGSNKGDFAKNQPSHDVLPGGNRAVLRLANGKTIYLDNAQNGVLAKEGDAQINKTRDGQLVYQSGKSSRSATSEMNTVATPRGGQYQLVLNDGSKVWLNSASSVSFPTVFTGNTRDVEITGEAYFEVAKNAAKPFRVKTNHVLVEVLGTHFNVMAYNDENSVKTTLLEGAVKISNNENASVLKPGQQASLNQNGQIKVVDDADAENSVAWKDGLFQFTDSGIEAIMRQVARWYDVSVSYEGKIPEREFTGRISRNVKASELLNMLKYEGINFKIEDKHITITK
jgi:hypothetical protein